MKNIRALITSFRTPSTVVSTDYSLNAKNLKVIADMEGYELIILDGNMIKTRKELLDCISIEFRFPDYFGHNFDALYDCLTDLDIWLPAKGYITFYKNPDNLIRNSFESYNIFVDVVKDVSAYWRLKGVQFILVLET